MKECYILRAREITGTRGVLKTMAKTLSPDQIVEITVWPVGSVVNTGVVTYSKENKEQLWQKLNRRIEFLPLPTRAKHFLGWENVVYLGDLVQKTERNILRIKNLGRKSLRDIKQLLESEGLFLGMDIQGWPRG